MAVVSLSYTITVHETTASSLKQSVPRACLAPQKGHRRGSLDVSSHVATVTSTPESHSIPLSGQAPLSLCSNSPSNLHWTPAWTKGLQTKFSAVWENWQKLSTKISQYKSLRSDWVGHTQELFDQQFQRFLGSVGAVSAARATSTGSLSSGSTAAATNRPVTLTPYLTVAHEVEVSFAAMLSDLCNMAYEVDKLDADLLEARYELSLIATSSTCSSTCASPSAALDAAGGGEDQESHAQRQEQQRDHAAAPIAEAAALDITYGSHPIPSIVSFTMGDSPPLSPSISLLQLTSPEAVTAALTSQGHGAAFSRPVYVSSLQNALCSMGSYDEEGDISDLELRAAMNACSPHAVLLGDGNNSPIVGSVGSLFSLGTMGTLDEISMAMMKQPLAIKGNAGPAPTSVGVEERSHGMLAAQFQAPLGSAMGTAAGMAGRGIAASSTLLCDVDLCEDRDFVAGHVYGGYNTQLVERRKNSSDGGDGAGVDVEPVAAVARSGAAGGRALREEQTMRRRSSSSGGTIAAGTLSGDAAAGAAASFRDAVNLDAMGSDGRLGAGGPPVVVACTKAPPSAWFACDDHQRRVRYFAIQGSTSLEHWQINLQFEPVVFEDPKYGVRIHRGVYEAAKVLYDDLLPLVKEHVESSPYATVSFSGHSLGGSLGTVLMLLFVMRGVLKPANISPVYTFGAPAVFCQGAVADVPQARCANCSLNCEMRAAGAGGPSAGITATATSMEQSQSLPLGLMAGLGLSEDQVVNVIMHKDIVPRAFVCDYNVVAGVLQRWMPSFRDHHSLQDDVGPHKSLYNFVGRLAVLRPSVDLPFVSGPADAAHPMLPNHPALYRVGLHEEHMPSLDLAAASLASWDELLGAGWAAMASGGCRRNRAAAAARRTAKLEGMQQSVMEFMNQPHPLAMLSDYQAYGPTGCISRFHNPDNYTRALHALSSR